jgi:cytochrome c-type biogenesis protein CcmH
MTATLRLLRLARSFSMLVLLATVMPPPAGAQAPAAPSTAPSAAPAPPAAGAPPASTAPAGAAGAVDTDRGAAAANDSELMKTERFRRLAGELRCLVCQNQSLVDSNAPLAQDLREEVVKLMASGRDDGQIKAFLVDRYGEFVLYRPALSLRNALLWSGPFLLLVIAAVAWWRLGRRKPAAAQSAQDALRHVDELLGR